MTDIERAAIELAHQVAVLALSEGEEWRLNHPELMDSYQAVMEYLREGT